MSGYARSIILKSRGAAEMSADWESFSAKGRPVALLADTVKRRRKTLGLRQADLADLAGCSERFVHTVENGKTSLRLDKVLDVLEVLGLDLLVVRKRSGPGAAPIPKEAGER